MLHVNTYLIYCCYECLVNEWCITYYIHMFCCLHIKYVSYIYKAWRGKRLCQPSSRTTRWKWCNPRRLQSSDLAGRQGNSRISHGEALLTERTQVVQDVLFHPVIEGAQDRVQGFLGNCRVNVLGGQSAHNELEAIVKPHLLRPQVDATPNDVTKVGERVPPLVHSESSVVHTCFVFGQYSCELVARKHPRAHPCHTHTHTLTCPHHA